MPKSTNQGADGGRNRALKFMDDDDVFRVILTVLALTTLTIVGTVVAMRLL